MKKTVYKLPEKRMSRDELESRLMRRAVYRKKRQLEKIAFECGFDFEAVISVTISTNSKFSSVVLDFDEDRFAGELELFSERLSELVDASDFDDSDFRSANNSYKLIWLIKKFLELHDSHERKIKSVAKRFGSSRSSKDELNLSDRAGITKEVLKAGGVFDLRGPSTLHDIDVVVSELHVSAPFLSKVTNKLWSSLTAYFEEHEEFGITPTLLVGGPGTGKSTLARTLCKASNLPFVEIDAGAGSSSHRLVGVESGWSTAQIGEVLRVIITQKCANPCIIVNEIDKAFTLHSRSGLSSMSAALLPLLERSTATQFRCPTTSLDLDLSSVMWLLTANDINRIDPVLLSRLSVITLDSLSLQDMRAYIDVKYPGIDDDVVSDVLEALRPFEGYVCLRHVDRVMSELVFTQKPYIN